jgi:hypothetical protein
VRYPFGTGTTRSASLFLGVTQSAGGPRDHVIVGTPLLHFLRIRRRSVASSQTLRRATVLIVGASILKMLRIKFLSLTVAGVLIAAVAAAEPAVTACTLPADPAAIAAAIDAAITGPADKDRTCMKQLFLPDARLVVVANGADGATTETVLTLDDWIARVKARGNVHLEEKQLKFSIESFGSITHLCGANRWQASGARHQQHPGGEGQRGLEGFRDPVAGGVARCSPSPIFAS